MSAASLVWIEMCTDDVGLDKPLPGQPCSMSYENPEQEVECDNKAAMYTMPPSRKSKYSLSHPMISITAYKQ
jgi:hypothetical protein